MTVPAGLRSHVLLADTYPPNRCDRTGLVAFLIFGDTAATSVAMRNQLQALLVTPFQNQSFRQRGAIAWMWAPMRDASAGNDAAAKQALLACHT